MGEEEEINLVTDMMTTQFSRRTCQEKLDIERIEQQMKKITVIEQQPSCNTVFKQLLSRLLKEHQKFGLPSDSSDDVYEAKLRHTRQAVAEIEAFLKGGDSYRTGELDNAVIHFLVELEPHGNKAGKWRFEDLLGVKLDTIIQTGLYILTLVAFSSTELWSTVSWFIQIFYPIIIFISFFWNWLYLYLNAFAEYQYNMVKMDSYRAICIGIEKMDWIDHLKGKTCKLVNTVTRTDADADSMWDASHL
ncbi:chloride channel CLIC-like protein 1 [Genypterus blacodes]|uniref:chloride channel CLIC-like protein 1 n=1 Tax=Genypterus blacodes TaxID=154954 RepID=UPI003F76D504